MINIQVYDLNQEIVNNLVQWDYDVTIVAEDDRITKPYSVHFFNSKTDEALVMSSTYNNGRLTTKVPNLLLQDKYPITGYIYIKDENGNKSLLGFRIPIIARPRPSNYIDVDTDDYASITEILNECRAVANQVDSYKEEAASHASVASANANHAQSFADTAGQKANEASESALQANNYADAAKQSEINAKNSEGVITQEKEETMAVINGAIEQINELDFELLRRVGNEFSNVSQTIIKNIILQAQGWISNNGTYIYDYQIDGCSAKAYPSFTVDDNCVDVAIEVRLNHVSSLDGYVRFMAIQCPISDITGTLIILKEHTND